MVAKKVRSLNLSPETQEALEHKAIEEITVNADKLASDNVHFEAKSNVVSR